MNTKTDTQAQPDAVLSSAELGPMKVTPLVERLRNNAGWLNSIGFVGSAMKELEAAAEIDRLLLSAEAELQSRRMFVARLEEISKHGEKAITAEEVLAMISDCDFLAANQSA